MARSQRCLQVKPAQCVDVVSSAKSPSPGYHVFFRRINKQGCITTLGCQTTSRRVERLKLLLNSCVLTSAIPQKLRYSLNTYKERESNNKSSIATIQKISRVWNFSPRGIQFYTKCMYSHTPLGLPLQSGLSFLSC